MKVGETKVSKKANFFKNEANDWKVQSEKPKFWQHFGFILA